MIVESAEVVEEGEAVAKINKVYGARGAYIANTLLSDREQVIFVCLWSAVAAVILVGMSKMMRSTFGSEAASTQKKNVSSGAAGVTAMGRNVVDVIVDDEFPEPTEYTAMPAPKSNS